MKSRFDGHDNLAELQRSREPARPAKIVQVWIEKPDRDGRGYTTNAIRDLLNIRPLGGRNSM